MYNGVPAWILLEIAQSNGFMHQLDIELPPYITIDADKLTEVPLGYTWNDTSCMSSTDHPAFTQLRDNLESSGYIKTVRNCSNADTVLQEFYLNDIFFDVGKQFPCASALGSTYKLQQRKLSIGV